MRSNSNKAAELKLAPDTRRTTSAQIDDGTDGSVMNRGTRSRVLGRDRQMTLYSLVGFENMRQNSASDVPQPDSKSSRRTGRYE
jgi:hypothetical protein